MLLVNPLELELLGSIFKFALIRVLVKSLAWLLEFLLDNEEFVCGIRGCSLFSLCCCSFWKASRSLSPRDRTPEAEPFDKFCGGKAALTELKLNGSKLAPEVAGLLLSLLVKKESCWTFMESSCWSLVWWSSSTLLSISLISIITVLNCVKKETVIKICINLVQTYLLKVESILDRHWN